MALVIPDQAPAAGPGFFAVLLCLKRLFLVGLVLLVLGAQAAQAQSKFMTRTGRVSFFSTSIIEDIEAQNAAAVAVIELGSNQLAFSIPIKEFVFKRTLMQEHFNENYMESQKYPRATFSGRFTGIDPAIMGVAGPHPIQVEGDLTIHGVTHHVNVPGTLELKSGLLLAHAYFSVAPADYGIEVPLLVRENIAKIVSIRVSLACDPAGTTAPAARANSAK